MISNNNNDIKTTHVIVTRMDDATERVAMSFKDKITIENQDPLNNMHVACGNCVLYIYVVRIGPIHSTAKEKKRHVLGVYRVPTE